jgi:hypothetical protein
MVPSVRSSSVSPRSVSDALSLRRSVATQTDAYEVVGPVVHMEAREVAPAAPSFLSQCRDFALRITQISTAGVVVGSTAATALGVGLGMAFGLDVGVGSAVGGFLVFSVVGGVAGHWLLKKMD